MRKRSAKPRRARSATRGAPKVAVSFPPLPALKPPETAAEPLYKLGVTPLDARPNRVPPVGPSEARPPAVRGEKLGFDILDDGAWIEGRRRDVEPAALDRLRRGAVTPAETVDLHGMTVEVARRAVRARVKRALTAGSRVLLVVHGKGVHSPLGYGSIRREIAGWLTEEPCASSVECFASARPEHGGTGALYVLLGRPGPQRLP